MIWMVSLVSPDQIIQAHHSPMEINWSKHSRILVLFLITFSLSSWHQQVNSLSLTLVVTPIPIWKTPRNSNGGRKKLVNSSGRLRFQDLEFLARIPYQATQLWHLLTLSQMLLLSLILDLHSYMSHQVITKSMK